MVKNVTLDLVTKKFKQINEYPLRGKGIKKKPQERYAKAVEKYPDLRSLPVKLAIKAYEFREILLYEYSTRYNTELANARSNPQLNGLRVKYAIPSDLPFLDFEKDCIVCHDKKEGISICPNCWRLIRKCLNLKGKSYREGWEGWGFEMNLDLSGLVSLLKIDEEGCKSLERQ
jgi:hypothetical protein